MADEKSTTTFDQVKMAAIIVGKVAVGVASAHHGTADNTEHLTESLRESHSITAEKQKKQTRSDRVVYLGE